MRRVTFSDAGLCHTESCFPGGNWWVGEELKLSTSCWCSVNEQCVKMLSLGRHFYSKLLTCVSLFLTPPGNAHTRGLGTSGPKTLSRKGREAVPGSQPNVLGSSQPLGSFRSVLELQVSGTTTSTGHASDLLFSAQPRALSPSGLSLLCPGPPQEPVLRR